MPTVFSKVPISVWFPGVVKDRDVELWQALAALKGLISLGHIQAYSEASSVGLDTMLSHGDIAWSLRSSSERVRSPVGKTVYVALHPHHEQETCLFPTLSQCDLGQWHAHGVLSMLSRTGSNPWRA